MKIYQKIHPLNSEKKQDTKYCFCVTDNEFVDFDVDLLKKIDERSFFTFDENNTVKKLRRRNEYVLAIREEHLRDTRNLRRKNPVPDDIGESCEVIALTQPHRYVHKKSKPARHKWVFDPLNNQFHIISNEKYEELGLSKFTRGVVVFKDKKGWSKLGKNGAVRVEKTIDEIKAQSIQNDICDNLIFWKDKLKYNRKCLKCVNDCKQFASVELVYCKMYKKKPKE